MSIPPEQYTRIAGRLDLELVSQQMVVVVGIGMVGSQIVLELARSGVMRFILIDGDHLERHNLVRHALTARYVGRNKAEAMTEFLSDELGVTASEAIPREVDENVSDEQVDELLSDASLIVSATDNQAVQRRIAERGLALDIQTVLPGLYPDGGGEVFVQLNFAFPCFGCWSDFRRNSSPLRGATALNADGLRIIELATRICLGILDQESEYADLIRPEPNGRWRQLFRVFGEELSFPRVQRRANCLSCGVRPAPIRQREAEDRSTSPAPVEPMSQAVRSSRRQLLGIPASAQVPVILAAALTLLFGVYGLPKLTSSPRRNSSAGSTCKTQSCFSKAYAHCLPVSWTASTFLHHRLVEKNEYRILSRAELGCMLHVNILPTRFIGDWAGKEMTCEFSYEESKYTFAESVTSLYEYPRDYYCKGSLTRYLPTGW